MILDRPVHKSTIKLFHCGFKAHQHLVEGVPLEENVAMLLGSAVHKAIHTTRTSEEHYNFVEYPAGYGDDFVAMCAAAFDDDLFLDGEQFHEQHIEADGFAGKLDRIILPPEDPEHWRHRMLVVQDYKGGWDTTIDWFEVKEYLYLALNWGQRAGADFDKLRFTYHFLRSGWQPAFDYSAEEVAASLPELNAKVAACEDMPPIPIPSRHCEWCQFLGTSCPLGSGLNSLIPSPKDSLISPQDILKSFLKTGAITPEKAPIVAFGMQWLEKVLKESRDKLKDYLDENGPIIVGNQEVYLRHVPVNEYGYAWTKAVMDKAQVPEDLQNEVFSVSKRGLGKLKKEYPDTHDAIVAVGLDRTPKRLISVRDRK